jgi:hypothetical protein
MSDLYTVKSRIGATTPCYEFADKGTGRTVDFIDALGAPQKTFTVAAVVTQAQLNAGQIIVPADPLRNIIPVGAQVIVTGSLSALTDLRISDTNGTPVDIVTILQAQLTNGANLSTYGGTGITLGTFGLAVTAGAGIQVRKTGSAATGGTSVLVIFEFMLG